MRPTRLEVAGFASFREPAVVDLDGVDLFALTGPTGSGKTSLLDAITFALYGSVARYDDRRLVAPVISQGRMEARVRLDFFVGDRPFTAVRVVRRTPSGASTREARLESSGTTLAGNERELTAAVERLLGLTFDHFIRCVVLPQGDFQRFLHANPKERQDLLIRLLDLGIYRRLASQARERAARGEQEEQLLAQRLETELAGATPQARAAAQARVHQLDQLLATVEAARPELDALTSEGARARASADEAGRRADALTSVTVPADVAALAGRLAAAADQLQAAEAVATSAADDLDAAEDARRKQPDLATLRSGARVLARRSHLIGQLVRARTEHATVTAEAAAAADGAQQAARAVRDARATLDEQQRDHAAHILGNDLRAGQPCPVCRQPVDTVPAVDPPGDLVAARDALTTAEDAAAHAEAERRRAEAEVATASSRIRSLETQLADVDAELAAVADVIATDLTPETVQATLREAEQADAAVAAARDAERRARRRRADASQALHELTGALDAQWQAFDRVRDQLAGLGLQPPPAERADLAGSWATLAAWAAQHAPVQRQIAAAARATLEGCERRYRARLGQLRAACAAAGIDTDAEPRDAIVAGRAAAQATLDRLDRDLTEAAQLRARRRSAAEAAAVARTLGRHLDARNFERWLLARALRRLLAGASTILRDLSAGAFSLALDDAGAFQVVDHRNADERRPARTLSGGETFLASLALALSLAEHLADLAAHGSARLDALFLDEGFGTLDADTLDTVAAAIEELGARGRMVGLVTHVRELAERVPVRYEIRKVASSSTVEKVPP